MEMKNGDYLERVDIDRNRYFSLTTSIEDIIDQPWNVTILIEEDYLLGQMKQKFKTMNLVFLVIGFMSLTLGSVAISVFISSVIKISNTLKETSLDGNKNKLLKLSLFSFKETDVLVNAYNHMIKRIGKAVNTVKMREKENKILLENTDALIFSMRADGQLVSFNSKMKASTGLSDEEIGNSNFFDLFDAEENKTLWKNRVSQVMNTKLPIRATYEFLHRKEGRTIFDCRLVPFFNEKMEISLIVGLFINIVDLVKAQENLEQMMRDENTRLDTLVKEKTQELENAMDELIKKQTLASLGAMVAGISHEINTPLGVAVSSASFINTLIENNYEKILKGKITKTEFNEFMGSVKESISITSKSLDRAKVLIDSFKAISTSPTKKNDTEFSVVAYIDTTLLSLHHELKDKKHRIIINGDRDILLKGSIIDFSQIISNLIRNSITHGFSEIGQGEIIISLSQNKNHVFIRYEDNGKGISEDSIDKIFDPFFTLDRSFGGSGLGLYAVHNIIYTKYGGVIKVHNRSEGGIVFDMTFEKNYSSL